MSRPRFTPTYRLAAAGLLALVGASVSGQEMPAAGEALLLAYKHQPGSEQKFRLEAKSDLTVTPEGGLGPLPVSMKLNTTYAEKVTEAQDGTGTLTTRLEAFLVDTNFLGNALVGKLEKGKMVYTLNNQPAPPDGPVAALVGAVNPTQVFTVKRTPSGAIAEGGAPNVGGVGPGSSLAQFPDRPVKVGDTWETTRPVGAGLQGPGAAAGTVLVARYTHTLKEVVKKDGRRFAMIQSSGAATPADQAEAPDVRQSLSGLTRFDIERGVMVSGQYKLDLSMKVAAPALLGAAAANGGGAVPMMQLDGLTTITVLEATAAPNGKKPTGK